MQQHLQHFANGAPFVAQRHQVPTVHRQLVQIKARLSGQHLLQQLLASVQITLPCAELRCLCPVVGPLDGDELPQSLLADGVQKPQHTALGVGQRRPVAAHQQLNAGAALFFHPHAAADVRRHVAAHLIVSVKVACPLLIHGEARRLTHIVQQHGPAQNRLRRNGLHRMDDMLPHGIAVVLTALVESYAGQELRQKDAEHLRVCQQYPPRTLAAQQLIRLGQNPLDGNVFQSLPVLADTARRVRLYGEIHHRGKAQPPHDAQGILTKPPLTLAHTAKDPLPQVLLTAEGVGQTAPPVHGHGVDGEIAAA